MFLNISSKIYTYPTSYNIILTFTIKINQQQKTRNCYQITLCTVKYEIKQLEYGTQ